MNTIVLKLKHTQSSRLHLFLRLSLKLFSLHLPSFLQSSLSHSKLKLMFGPHSNSSLCIFRASCRAPSRTRS
ncbi:hypothetical protein RSAG8_02698, partial [Rhizoctonia solani AG-8 WAC10335]